VTWSPKSPADVADYYIDWSEFLSSTESITSASVTAPAGITAVENSFTSKVVRIRLSGGTAGTTYSIVCTVTTTNSETFSVTKPLLVETRVAQW
jgi:hypothetical protein